MAVSKIQANRNVPYILQEVKVSGNGTNWSNVYAPSIDGYTPVGIVGAFAYGSFDAYKNLFQLYMRSGVINAGWSPALSSDYAITCIVLYLPT